MWSLTLVLATAVALAACGRDRAAGMRGVTVDTLPTGGVRVSNPEAGQWSGSGWRLVEALRIGSVDGTGADVFGRIAGLAVDDLGRIWVLDDQARELRVFDSDGRHIRTVGRSGSGPGEFTRPHSVHRHPDGTIWVVDPPNQRYSVFDTSGVFLTSHVRALRSSSQPRSEGFDARGRLMEMVGRFSDGRVTYALLRLDPERGVVLDSVAIPSFQEEVYEAVVQQEGGTARYWTRVPFTPFLFWTTDREGHLWHGSTVPYRIVRQSFAGDTVLIVEREYTPLPVSSAERATALEEVLAGFRNMGASVSESRIPRSKPAFEYLFVDGTGHLWVQPVVAGTPPSDGAVLTDFDVFDPRGVYLGRLHSPVRLTTNPAPPGRVPPIVHGNFLYGVHTDTLGVHAVVRLRIEGR